MLDRLDPLADWQSPRTTGMNDAIRDFATGKIGMMMGAPDSFLFTEYTAKYKGDPAKFGAGSLPRLRVALLAADGERPAARLHPAVDARSGAALLQRTGLVERATVAAPATTNGVIPGQISYLPCAANPSKPRSR